MRIHRSRIINAALYLDRIEERFQVVCDLEGVPEERRSKVGLPANAVDGDAFLPSAIGKISRFNSEGRWIVRRDLSKEPRYIRTVFWQWTTWNGDEHSDFKDIYRDCYPRDPISPPSVQLLYRIVDERRLVVSPVLTNSAASQDHCKHVINLFLELFGRCDLLEEGTTVPPPLRTKQVNWRFLPPGQYPWDRLKEHLDGVLAHSPSGNHIIIQDREDTIATYSPEEVYIGTAGFSDYIAYVFSARGLVILEGIKRDNALYVFGNDWEQCSCFSKAEVLSHGLHLDRIVHSQGWKDRLRSVMRRD